MTPSYDRSQFRLLPFEQVLYYGRRTPQVPHDRKWLLAALGFFGFGAVAAMFAGLFVVADLPGVRQTVSVAVYTVLSGIAFFIAPRYLVDPCEYMVTERRVIWRRGRMTRSMDRSGITFARIRWHRSVPRVGHLELVRAVPFGPLARKQRIVLHDVTAPDTLFGLIRGAENSPQGGDRQVPLMDRLDPGERLVWGGRPEGFLLGWRDVLTGILGIAVVVFGVTYAHRFFAILLGLEELGLEVRSWAWAFFFLAGAITWALVGSIGLGLFWHGFIRARALGRDTDYLLTDRRLLIRRGHTELSIDRRRIVDVADTPVRRGLHHLFLVLDAPQSRALAVSGALNPLTPARDSVPPILYELRDVERLKQLILSRDSRPTLRDAA